MCFVLFLCLSFCLHYGFMLNLISVLYFSKGSPELNCNIYDVYNSLFFCFLPFTNQRNRRHAPPSEPKQQSLPSASLRQELQRVDYTLTLRRGRLKTKNTNINIIIIIIHLIIRYTYYVPTLSHHWRPHTHLAIVLCRDA